MHKIMHKYIFSVLNSIAMALTNAKRINKLNFKCTNGLNETLCSKLENLKKAKQKNFVLKPYNQKVYKFFKNL